MTTCKGGGFGLRPVWVCVCLAAAVFALQYHVFFRWRARCLAQLSPANPCALRLAWGATALIALTVLASLRIASVTGASSNEIRDTAIVTDADRLIVPGFIIRCWCCALHHLRQALSCLLQVWLSIKTQGDFSGLAIRGVIPSNLVHLVGSTAEVVGPAICAVVIAHVQLRPLYANISEFNLARGRMLYYMHLYFLFWLSWWFYTAFGTVETNIELSATNRMAFTVQGRVVEFIFCKY